MKFKISLRTFKGLNYDQRVISHSEISILKGQNVKIKDTQINQVNKNWNPVWGQFSEINNHYNEIKITLNYSGFLATLYVRSYNHGIAFRFTIQEVPAHHSPSFFME